MSWALVVGLGAFLVTHTVYLGRVAGLHFDEAWAAYFSHSIAQGEAGMPWTAMSPYTAAWSHYVAAGFLKILGTSLLHYRISGIALVFAGIFLISRALVRVGNRRAATLLPVLTAFFTPLVINHRFTIEITTFHTFCFGLLCYGLAVRLAGKPLLAWACLIPAIVLGTTSHILFIAPVAAALGCAILRGSPFQRVDRAGVALTSLILTAHFAAIVPRIPEKDKAVALAIAGGAVLIWSAVFRCRTPVSARFLRAVRSAALFLSAPGFLILLFFSEGHWSILATQGKIANPALIFSSVAALAIVLTWAIVKSIHRPPSHNRHEKDAFLFMTLCTLFVSASMLKPAVRYFETPLLCLVGFLSICLSRLEPRPQRILTALFVTAGTLQLSLNYFLPALTHGPVDRGFRFLIFKDRSTDFLDKQSLVRTLSGQGFRKTDVTTQDPRIEEALRFLSIGDWPDVTRGHEKGGHSVSVDRAQTIDLLSLPRNAVRSGEFVFWPNENSGGR